MNAGQRVAVITGASQGLGLETARQLLEDGLTVVLTARNNDAGKQGLSELGENRSASFDILDVADQSSVDAFFDRLLAKHGRIDVLVNNAGRIYGGYGTSVVDTSVDLIAEAFNNNALGALRMIQKALPEMNRSGYGRIVNVSTGMGALNEMGTGAVPYRISKTAMNAITRITAGEAAENVKVNSVCPGWVRTEMGGPGATRSVREGAAGIVWAATLPDSGPSGGFFRDGKPIAW
jgi:NAD(P)-dependent dehydrogenase (short-subunit alcohol dehydrogenase family)